MSDSKTFVSSGEVEAVVVPGGARRALVWTDDIMIAEWTLPAGLKFPGHSHPDPQVGYVARGRVEFIVGEEKRVLESGGAYYVPPNVWHGGQVLEDSVTIAIHSPVREDWKPLPRADGTT